MTKISPIIRIAAPTAWRTNGSPARASSRLSSLACSLSLTRARPITSPQVALLTRVECDLPAWARQSASPSLSAISWSAVSGSGTRRKASASESRAMPSWVLSRYSWRNWLTQPDDWAPRSSASIAARPFLDPPARIAVERGVASAAAPAPRVRGRGAAGGTPARADAVASCHVDGLAEEGLSSRARRGSRDGALARHPAGGTMWGAPMPLASIEDIKSRSAGGSASRPGSWSTRTASTPSPTSPATQFIHVDPEAAARTPFGGTIAHGFLTLSLLSQMAADVMLRARQLKMGVNYGFDRVRFIAPVRSGKRVRGRFTSPLGGEEAGPVAVRPQCHRRDRRRGQARIDRRLDRPDISS